jgi:hypothetical protein
MTNKLISCLLGLFISFSTIGQISLDSALAAYDNLDWNYFPTGNLYNRIPFDQLGDLTYKANPLRLHPDSLASYSVSAAVFEQLYYDMALADRYEIDFKRNFNFDVARLAWASQGDIPIGFMSFEVDYIKPEAFGEYWIAYDTLTGQYFHPGDTLYFQDSIPTDTTLSNYSYLDTAMFRPNGGYVSGMLGKTQVMAISLLDRSVGLNDLSEPVRYFIPESVHKLGFLGTEIDFDDGNGWQSVQANGEYDVYYSSFGVKQVKVRSTIRATEAEVAGTFDVTVYQLAPSPNKVVSSFTPSACVNGLNTKSAGDILLSVRYAEGHEELKNPVLIVEDFDERRLKDGSGNIQQNSKVDGYGTIGYQGIQTGRVFDEVGNEVFRYGYSKNMVDSLLANGLDVVFVDFKDSWASIETNGKAVMLAIDWVNKEIGYQKSFSAIGIGTGGLMLNYALNRFEQGGCCHNVAKFIAFDTPFKGLNIPISLQHNSRYFNTGNSSDGKLLAAKGLVSKKVTELLQSPLMQEIVVYNIERGHIYTMATIDPLPKDCYNIAISNGSLQGNNYGFGQGTKLFDMGVVKRIDEIERLACGKSYLYYRRGKTFSIQNQNQYGNQNIFEYTDAGLEDNGNYHRTRNKIIGYSLSFILLAIVLIAISPEAGAIIAFILFIIACFTIDDIIDDYNNSFEDARIYTTTLAYDNAPGSRATALGGIFSTERSFYFKGYDIGDEYSTPTINEFSLVPTTSALGIEPNNLNLNISLLSLEEFQELSSFNTFYIDPEQGNVHQYHAEFTERNAQYLYEQVKEVVTPTFSLIAEELDQYYNFGKEQEQVIGDVLIEPGGELAINDKNTWGYAGTGGVFPPFDNKIQVYTKECGSYIDIQNTGFLDVGSSIYTTSGGGNQLNQRVEFFVNDGSIIEVRAGGVLVVRDSSRLIIEEGAELILHPGAFVELDGHGATLELQGKLTLKSEADFIPSGTGIVRFNQPMQLSTAHNFLSYGGGNTIVFDNGPKMEVLTNTWFTTSLDSLAIVNTSVYIASAKGLAVQSSFSTNTSKYLKLPGEVYLHNGLQLFGQAHAKVENSEFAGGNYGLLAFLATYGNPITVTDCHFHDCGSGIETHGKRATVVDCLLEDNVIGWNAIDHDGECEFTSSLTRYNNTGVRFVGQIGSKLTVHESDIRLNTYGVTIVGSILRSTCSLYEYNQYGIQGSDSELDLASQAQNTFDNSGDDILLDDANSCKLDNGFNLFSAGNSYINGTLTSNAIPTLHNSGSGYALPVKDNDLPAVGGSVAINITLSGNPIGLYNWSPIISYPQFCQSAITNNNVCPTCSGKTLQMSAYSGMYLNEVIDAAFVYIVDTDVNADPADNLVAMDMLTDVMDYVHSNAKYGEGDEEALGDHVMDADEFFMMDQAFAYYMMALSNAYRFEVLTPNRAEVGGPVNAYLEYIIQEAQYRLNHQVPNSQDPYLKGFYYSLAQPQAYRIGEHYYQALNLLSEAPNWAEADELKTAQYWECVYSAEEELILEEIDSESFLYLMSECVDDVSAKRIASFIPSINHGGVKVDDIQYPASEQQSLTVTVFPNPSKGNYTLSLEGTSDNEQVCSYFIYSLHGSLLFKGQFEGTKGHINLEEKLSDGAYTLVVKQNGQTVSHHKLVVVE